MRVFRILGWLVMLLLITAVAQTGKAQDNPNFEMGLKPYGSYHGGNIDKVNLGNGGLTVEIPLISYPQRGDKLALDFSLIYQNKSGYIDDVCVPDGGGESCWYQAFGTVGSFTFVDKASVFPSISSGSGGCWTDSAGYQWCDLQLQESDGAVHQLARAGTGLWVSADATGYRVPSGSGSSWYNPTSVIDPHGTSYTVTSLSSMPCFDGNLAYGITYGWSGPAYGSGNYTCAPSRQDSNGNQITVSPSTGWTDSVGRTIPPPTMLYSGNDGNFSSDSSACTGGQTVAYIVVWSPPGYNSGTYPLKFCYFYDSTAEPYTPDNADFGAFGSLPASHLESVILPNNTAWTFYYTTDGLYNLSQIVFPTGGTITYTWGRTSGNCADLNVDDYNAAVTQRVLNPSDGGHTVTTNYSYTGSPTVYTKVTEVSSAGNNDSVHTFGLGACILYETEEQDYSGSSSSGTLLKTVNTTYYYLANPTSWWALPNTILNLVPTQVTTTLNDSGQENEVQTTYDTNLGFWPPVNPDSGAYGTEQTGTYGNVIAKSEYDFGSGSPGSALRITSTGYQAFSSSYYLSKNLLDLPSYVQVTDGGSTERAYTTYLYDESIYSPSGCSSTTPCGNQTTVEGYKDGSNHVDTHTTYSSHGMPTVETDARGNSTNYTYDSTNAYVSQIQYPDTVTNSTTYHHIECFNHDFNSGLLTSQTDQNGTTCASKNTTTYTYDVMRRLTSVSYPDWGSDAYNYSGDSGAPNPYFFFTKAISSSPTENFVEEGVVDGLGRKVRTATIVPSTICYGGDVFVATAYDDRGRIGSVSNPYCTTSDPNYGLTTYSYDALNRVTKVIPPDGTSSSNNIATSYSGSCTTVTDQQLKARKSCVDGLGRMTSVQEDPSGLNYYTYYTYDTLDNLTGVSQGSQTRTFAYDFLSRLTSAANPESGTTSYTYDNNGNVATKLDARGITSTYGYDQLNRVISTSYTDSSHTVYPGIYPTYDMSAPFGESVTNPVGRMVGLWRGISSSWVTWKAFSYDKMGRIVTQWDCFPWLNCSNATETQAQYDLAGDIQYLIYPSGRKVKYSVNTVMQPTQIWFDSLNGTSVEYNYLSSASYSPFGGPTSLTLGSGVVDASTYNNRGQLYTRSVTLGSTPYMNLSYNYTDGSGHNNGNVMAITDSFDSGRSSAYSYDNLNRLLTAATSGSANYPAWGLSWSGGYDRYGNRTAQTVTAGSSMPSSSLSISTTTNRITTSGFVYDADGDLTTDGFNSLSYDEENRLTSASNGGGSAAYNYAGDGTRVQKVSGSAWTNYVYFGGKDIAEYDAGGGVEAEYVYAGNKLLAMPGNAANGGFEEGAAGWTLGTGASVVTNATNAHSGGSYLQLSTSTGSEALGGYVAVSPGETIVFGGWVYCQSGSSTYTSWDLIAYNSSYGVVSYQLPSPSTVTSATWTYQIGTYTVPSGVAYVQLYAQIYLPTGATVARFDDGFLSAGTLYYHQDHLSNRLITNSAGSDTAPNTGQQGHFPYGEMWYPNPPSPPVTKWVFTGKERDSESGLDNFGARYNSSQYGRFMSPDPANIKADVEDFSDPQGWNGYAYVRNNPLNLTDPDGQSYQVCVPDDQNQGQQKCTTVSDAQFSDLQRNPGSGISLRNGDVYGTDTNGNQTKVGSYVQTDVDLPPGVGDMLHQAGTMSDAGVKAAMILTAPEYLVAAGGAAAVELAGQSSLSVFEGAEVAVKDHALRHLASDALKSQAKAAIQQAINSGQIRYISGGTFIGRVLVQGQEYVFTGAFQNGVAQVGRITEQIRDSLGRFLQ